jgi:hypothetical protein
MIIHHTTLMGMLVKASMRLKQDGKPHDQLVALIRELDAISEHAEAQDAKVMKLLGEAKKILD